MTGRFFSIDPFVQKYPWYTSYQFSGNGPIANIDLDGLEKVNISIFQALTGLGKPKLEKSEWYQFTDFADWSTFAPAAKYNAENNNPGAYQSIEDRHNWYVWAEENTKSAGNFWFAAAADVTSWRMVGGAEVTGHGIFLHSNASSLLSAANQFLLKENFKNFGAYASDPSHKPITWRGTSYGNLKGSALDNQMVVIEMTNLQGFLDDYKIKFVKENGSDEWIKLSANINSMFSNYLLLKFSPGANKYAQEKFIEKYGKNAKFDFMKLSDRIFQGQAMAEYLRTHAQGDIKPENKNGNTENSTENKNNNSNGQ